MCIRIVDVNVVNTDAEAVALKTQADSGSGIETSGLDAPVRRFEVGLFDGDSIGGDGIARTKFGKELDAPCGDELGIQIDGYAVKKGLPVELFEVKATEAVIVGTQAKTDTTSYPVFGHGSEAIVIGYSMGEEAAYINDVDLTV